MNSVQDEVERLTPLMRDAEQAHRDFKAHWTQGAESMGWRTYKQTEVYGRTLEKYQDAQRRLEEAEGQILRSVQTGTREGVWSALAYLSIRHRPFRSGYLTQRLARALKKLHLGEEEGRILQGILLDRLTWPWAQPRELWGLIPGVRTPKLAAEIRSLTDDDRRYVQRRAFDVISRFHLGSGKAQ